MEVGDRLPEASSDIAIAGEAAAGPDFLSDRDHALTVFNELLAMISKDEHKGRDKQKYAEFAAFALAGKCVILSSQQKYRESADVMKQLWDYRDDLRDNKMNKLVQEEAGERQSAEPGPRHRQGLGKMAQGALEARELDAPRVAYP